MGRRRKAWLANGSGKRKVNGTKQKSFTVEWHEYQPNGRMVHRSKSFPKREWAVQFQDNHNARLSLSELGEVIRVPFPEAVTEFIQGCSALSHDTRVHYTSALGMLRAIVEDTNVCDIDSAQVDEFVARRTAASSAPTVLKHIRSLKRFFNWAVQRNYATHNPADRITSKPTSDSVRERPAVDIEMIQKIIDQVDTEDRRIAVWLAMTTGLDRGAITNLTPEQIDLENRCIVRRRTKTGKINTVPIHESLVPLLADRIARTDPDRPVLAGLHCQSKNDWWRIAARKAGVPMWFRDLRAFATSRLIREGGVSLPDVQRLLGHSSPETTARH